MWTATVIGLMIMMVFAFVSAQEDKSSSSVSTLDASPTTPHYPMPSSIAPPDHSQLRMSETHETMTSPESSPPMASSQSLTMAVVYTRTSISPSVYTQLASPPGRVISTCSFCETASHIVRTEDIIPTVTPPTSNVPTTSLSAAPVSKVTAVSVSRDTPTPSAAPVSKVTAVRDTPTPSAAPVSTVTAVPVSRDMPTPSAAPVSSGIPMPSDAQTRSTPLPPPPPTTTTTTTTTTPTPPPTTGPGDRTSIGDRLAMLPVWVWAAVIVGLLFLCSCCAIFCTICLCAKRSKSPSNRSSQQASRRASIGTLTNEAEKNPESATSTLEILYPSQETSSKKGRPVSRWDSLRNSWSRHSSRRRVSTFKPQKQNEGKMSPPGSNSKKPWQLPDPDLPEQLSTFGNHSREMVTPDSDQYKSPVPCYGSADHQRSASHTSYDYPVPNPSYGTPDYKGSASSLSRLVPSYGNPDYGHSPIPSSGSPAVPNSSYGNPHYHSFTPGSSYGNPAIPNSGYRNPDYHSLTPDPSSSYGSPAIPNSSHGNPDYHSSMPAYPNRPHFNPKQENPHYKSPVPNPGSYQPPIPNPSYNPPDYPLTDPSPSYGTYHQKAIPNSSYGGNHNDQRPWVHADTANGYRNPIFDMKDTRLGRQESNTRLTSSQEFRQSLENSLSLPSTRWK